MAIHKYICRCGNSTDKLTSYFIGAIRVTACEKCEDEIKRIPNAIAVNYEDVVNDNSKQVIDTREK